MLKNAQRIKNYFQNLLKKKELFLKIFYQKMIKQIFFLITFYISYKNSVKTFLVQFINKNNARDTNFFYKKNLQTTNVVSDYW